MGTMSIGKLLATMAVPMMISMLVQALYNIVDSIFVAQISENALNAVSLAFPLQHLMIAVGGGTAVGMNAILSRSLGEKNQDAVDRSANTGIFVFLCSAVVFTVVGLTLSRPFFAVQTDISEIVDSGTAYTSICLGASIGIFCQFCFERLLQSTGRTSLAMVTQLVGAITNIILDPIMIFKSGAVLFDGAFTMPFGLGLGVAGAALATVTGQILAALLALIINLKKNPEINIRVRLIKPDRPMIAEIYRVGFPSIIMQSIGSVMTFSLNQILIDLHTVATAVFGAYFKLQSFIFMPIFGLNNAMVPIVAYNYGARRIDRIKKTIIVSILAAEALMFLGLLLFELFPDVLLSFFNPSADMLKYGISALRTIALHFLLAGVSIISLSVCQAIGNPIYALIVSVCRQLVVLVPVAWLLSLTKDVTKVWFAFPIAEFVAVVLSLFFLLKTLRAVARRIKESEAAEAELAPDTAKGE